MVSAEYFPGEVDEVTAENIATSAEQLLAAPQLEAPSCELPVAALDGSLWLHRQYMSNSVFQSKIFRRARDHACSYRADSSEPDCDFKTRYLHDVLVHEVTRHGPQLKDSLECLSCHKTFTTLGAYLDHRKRSTKTCTQKHQFYSFEFWLAKVGMSGMTAQFDDSIRLEILLRNALPFSRVANRRFEEELAEFLQNRCQRAGKRNLSGSVCAADEMGDTGDISVYLSVPYVDEFADEMPFETVDVLVGKVVHTFSR